MQNKSCLSKVDPVTQNVVFIYLHYNKANMFFCDFWLSTSLHIITVFLKTNSDVFTFYSIVYLVQFSFNKCTTKKNISLTSILSFVSHPKLDFANIITWSFVFVI